MAFQNPSDATEILYGTSGDVRNEINAYAATTTAGHYLDEGEVPGQLIVTSLRKATRLINGYLEGVYSDQIPYGAIGDVPKLLDEISSDIATYYTLRSSVANVAPLSDNKKRDYFSDYISEDPPGILVQLRDRKVQLPEVTSSYPEDVSTQRTNRTPVFDLDSDTQQVVSPDLLDDIASDRD